ncbi:aldehyde dehydrogenase family protein [Lysinibacillus sp. BW-2-10]|uniref:aldehyde dehydrogenase family protein n=1 Tax=Lysinibacillus sp. BW-2-10 TaxID=2590030 RepID=UPI00117FAAED|nr:aldehyde dehydrogenase family protein [Lysinibacillus sp. BW-2-10]TSI09298.1 aldehyde dehydrogenase family protein [Lysinibacillus sp. BW-2-10]
MTQVKTTGLTKEVDFLSFTKSYINGQWVEGASERKYNDLNPYDHSVIATISIATKAQLEEAYQAAKAAKDEWAANTQLRQDVLKNFIQYLQDQQEAIINTLVLETGSSVLKSQVELQLTIGLLEETLKIVDSLGKVKTVDPTMPDKVNHVYRSPLGVVSTIAPFNFPLYLSIRSIAPALALGNTVVHKPDIQAGLSSGSIIAKALEQSGIPAGVFNSLLTDIEEIGDSMLDHPDVKLISFTGSTAVGRHIGRIAGGSFKRVALELGGNSPFIVLKDADVDQAVKAAIFGKFLHSGQICMAINRFIVHEDVYDEFAKKFVAHASTLPYGNPQDPTTIVGPLINQVQLDKALKKIGKLKEAGADVLLEGQLVGNVLTPYVFGNVDNSSEIAQNELFAPIAILIKASSDDHAIELANDTEYGLSSAIFTTDLARGEELALRVEAGMTHINDQTVNDLPNIPFGGVKASGVGRYGNPWIIDEFTETKWVSVQEKERPFPF